MTGTSDDEEGKWKNRSTTLRRLGRQYSPDVTPEVASRRLKQWIVGNPVLLGLLHENGWTASCIFRLLLRDVYAESDFGVASYRS